MIETDKDRQSYVDTFGIDVVINHVSQKAICDVEYIEDFDVASHRYILALPTIKALDITMHTEVLIKDLGYFGSVKEIRKDGSGFTYLVLSAS